MPRVVRLSRAVVTELALDPFIDRYDSAYERVFYSAVAAEPVNVTIGGIDMRGTVIVIGILQDKPRSLCEGQCSGWMEALTRQEAERRERKERLAKLHDRQK